MALRSSQSYTLVSSNIVLPAHRLMHSSYHYYYDNDAVYPRSLFVEVKK